MGNVDNVEHPESTVEQLARQIRRLTVMEQVQLLQCLTECIKQEINAVLPATACHENAPLPVPVEQPRAGMSPKRKVISPLLDDITYRIIGCAQAVHRRLGKGLREDSYQRALETQIVQAGLACRPQQKFAVYDTTQDGASGRLLGYYIPDFVIEDQVIVEIKALAATDASHTAQVIGYLAVSGCRVGLLINFGERSLHPRRILPPTDIKSHPVSTQWLWNPFQTS